MKIVFMFLLMVAATVVHAHSGHGEYSPISHDLEHVMWAVSGVVLLASLLAFWLVKRK